MENEIFDIEINDDSWEEEIKNIRNILLSELDELPIQAYHRLRRVIVGQFYLTFHKNQQISNGTEGYFIAKKYKFGFDLETIRRWLYGRYDLSKMWIIQHV